MVTVDKRCNAVKACHKNINSHWPIPLIHASWVTQIETWLFVLKFTIKTFILFTVFYNYTYQRGVDNPEKVLVYTVCLGELQINNV